MQNLEGGSRGRLKDCFQSTERNRDFSSTVGKAKKWCVG